MSGTAARRPVARRLARLAFDDADRAAELLCSAELQWWDPATNSAAGDSAAAVVAALGRSADPDAALAAVHAIVAAEGGREGLREALEASSAVRARVLGLLGASRALADHLVAHAGDWRAVCGDYDAEGVAGRLAAAVGADP
ncbi:MAG: [glutamine synthetase] adenylyltransferase / [glutamine synthetase]-adenylyl-L-tyrosine, partial [Pseudonocardiales bacterium]|nr:[glutamine synthetase] adenylyltransferase / [glutamine synthetase]-adenylyl-L-tyrosine [Pseudonocardiales bacterium]